MKNKHSTWSPVWMLLHEGRELPALSCAKMAEPIEMSFGVLSLVDLRNHMLDWGTDPPWDGAILRGKGMPWHTWQHSDVNCAKLAEPIEMSFGLWTRVGPRKHVFDGAQIPRTKGQLLGVRTCPGMPDDTLLWAVQKWLNRSICRFGCGFGWVEASTTSVVFARLCQCVVCHRVEYKWTVHRQQCGLTSNYFDRLFGLQFAFSNHNSISDFELKAITVQWIRT